MLSQPPLRTLHLNRVDGVNQDGTRIQDLCRRMATGLNLSRNAMAKNREDSVQCVAITYVGPFEIHGGEAFLEITLQLIDGSEVSYLVSRPAVRSLLEGLALAEKLARS